MADAFTTVGSLVGLALLGPLILLAAVRRDEQKNREPHHALGAAFLYGAFTGVALALFFNLLFGMGYPLLGDQLGLGSAFFAVVVGAPFGEELAKGLGLGLRRHRIREPEDGIIYGVAIGLGFAATENLVYALDALVQTGFEAALATLAMRTFSSMLLHAAASGILGFGYGTVVRRGGVAAEAIPHYLLAVLLHAAYNYLVFVHAQAGVLLAVAVALGAVVVLRRRIRALDALPHGAA